MNRKLLLHVRHWPYPSPVPLIAHLANETVEMLVPHKLTAHECRRMARANTIGRRHARRVPAQSTRTTHGIITKVVTQIEPLDRPGVHHAIEMEELSPPPRYW